MQDIKKTIDELSEEHKRAYYSMLLKDYEDYSGIPQESLDEIDYENAGFVNFIFLFCLLVNFVVVFWFDCYFVC